MRRVLLIAACCAAALLTFAGSAMAAPIRVAGIEGSGNLAANTAFSSGDLDGTITRLTATNYNAMSVSDLRANYDVLLFTWASSGSVNADWTTRILPYLQAGGGVVFEADSNIGDLAPAVVAGSTSGGGPFTLTPVAGLTDGLPTSPNSVSLVNSHFGLASWSSEFQPFMTDGASNTVGIYSTAFGGRIVITGPDQDYHASRPSQQYTLLVNELRWASEGAPLNAVPEPASLTILGIAVLGAAGYTRTRRKKRMWTPC